MPSIENTGQHPVTPFDNPMSYGMPDANGQFVIQNGENGYDANGNFETKAVQLVPYAFMRKAILDTKYQRRFQQLATTVEMPMHSGKSMQMYRYYPLIDDRNMNDQGIDANGLLMQLDENTKTGSGNLYGSSRDPGVIKDRMPWGREGGGRINRVGFTRTTIKGDLKKLQFFWEYTEDTLSFDSVKEHYKYITTLTAEACNKTIEDLIQIDLMDNAGVTFFGGTATSKDQLDNTSTLTYDLFVKMNQKANSNDVPTQTKMITGSRKTDTRVIPNARVVYAAQELMPDIERMKDYHDKQAFISVEHYASAGNILEGEAGKVGKFRIVEIDDMVRGGKGASGAQEGFYAEPTGEYSVFPLIMVGKDSFNAITLQGSNGSLGSKFKWRVISKKPGFATADFHDPYGENGFYSVRMYYGSIFLRPERIFVCYVTARM
jgi:N4-gp56 family major capsid protein